jgi:predicted HAD superfamily Cof-like phosphohydrolase
MLHKKQAFEQLQRTSKWNELRGNTPDTLDWSLEIDMLQEELDELKTAVAANDNVAILDALIDLKFVANGSLYKLGLSPDSIVDAYEAVILANEMKGTEKNSQGKIIKPKGWEQFAPEPKLQVILDKE